MMASCLFLSGSRRGWEGSGLACHTGSVYSVAVVASSGTDLTAFPLSVRRGGPVVLPFEHWPLPALHTQAGDPKEGAPESCMVWQVVGGVRDRLAGVGGSSQTACKRRAWT